MTDDEDLCHQGQLNNKKKKDPHSKTFGFDKNQRMVMFNQDQFYEVMADPWLKRN
jgi:hypothetical protein